MNRSHQSGVTKIKTLAAVVQPETSPANPGRFKPPPEIEKTNLGMSVGSRLG